MHPKPAINPSIVAVHPVRLAGDDERLDDVLCIRDDAGRSWSLTSDHCAAALHVRPVDDEAAIPIGFPLEPTERTELCSSLWTGEFPLGDAVWVEHGTGRMKINPLAHWAPEDVRAYMDENRLPRHPLVAKGYPSIGCAPCTTPVKEGEDPRAGRWRGDNKEECGIHVLDGKLVRTGA